MKQHIENTRRQLGELAAMSAQTETVERKILERAQQQLAKIQGEIDDARTDAIVGDDEAKQRYTHMVEERGRLQHVIAQANSVLGSA